MSAEQNPEVADQQIASRAGVVLTFANKLKENAAASFREVSGGAAGTAFPSCRRQWR